MDTANVKRVFVLDFEVLFRSMTRGQVSVFVREVFITETGILCIILVSASSA